MKIGQAAVAAGVTVKAIRHYEAEGLLGKIPRKGKYRELSLNDVERLRLIAHCRRLGFAVGEVQRIVSLVAEARPACPPPEAMLAVVQAKLRRVRAERRRLERAEAELDKARRYLEQRRSPRSA